MFEVFRLSAGIVVLLAGVLRACAQSSGVPSPDNYAAFSKFIADRNIFDPNRQPHEYNPNQTHHVTHIRTPHGTPGIQFVGTMSYEKGNFAFFSGNSMDLSKVLQVGDKLQDYTITDITATNVGLVSADKKEQIELKIGDGLRQENNKWVFSKADELPADGNVTAPAGSPSDSTSPASAAPPPEIQGNDVLKRLMEQRQKENQ